MSDQAMRGAAMEVQAPAKIENGNGGVLGLFEKAIDHLRGDGAGEAVAAIEKLMDLHERVQNREAKQAYYEALLQFQAACPPIPKTRTGKVEKDGVKVYSWDYADLQTVENVIRPHLRAAGLTYQFDQETKEGRVEVIVVLAHRLGHVERFRFECPEGDPRSKVTPQQQAGKANTYGKRQALVSALGLPHCGKDTDGGEPEGAPIDKITDDQLLHLEDMVKEVGADRRGFCEFLKVSELSDLPKTMYARAISALEAKKRGTP